MSSLFVAPTVTPPPANVPYTQVLREPGQPAVRPLLGLILALAGYALVFPLVSQLILAIGYLARGRHGSFSSYYADAMAFRLPEGMLAAHLGLASLIPVTLLLVRYLHGRPVTYLPSVQPGMRWRYLALAGVVALVVLNGVTWLAQIGSSIHWSVPGDAALWVVLIVLTSPFQAAAEEFFFRGYLMQGLGALVPNQWFGVVGSALVFAIFHGTQNVPLFVDRFGFGLLAGALVVLTGGLEAGIAAHVVNNLFAFGYAVFQGGVAGARTVTTLSWAGAGWDLLGFALFGAGAWAVGRGLKVATRTPGAAASPGLGKAGRIQ